MCQEWNVAWSEQQKIESHAPMYLRNVIRIITETGVRIYKELLGGQRIGRAVSPDLLEQPEKLRSQGYFKALELPESPTLCDSLIISLRESNCGNL